LSLKAFHIVFVAVAGVGLAFLSVWCFVFFANRSPLLAFLGGIGAALGIIALYVFERRILTSLREGGI
jgi:hypothetical protein